MYDNGIKNGEGEVIWLKNNKKLTCNFFKGYINGVC